MRTCLLLCLACLPLAAAQFNARISHPEIALNGVLTLHFSTVMPQRDHVDVAAAVRQACELADVATLWRLVGMPEVTQHERARDVQVVVRLMPRRAGELQPPGLPITWMAGDQVVEFPSVRVKPVLELGNRELPLPRQMDGVGAYEWGLAWERFAADHQVEPDADGWVPVKDGLRLRFAAGRLASAQLLSPGLGLERSRASLIERWGDPARDDEQGLTWFLGWLRIQASERDGATCIVLDHEGMTERAERQQVQDRIFDLLEDGPATAEEPVATDPTAAATTTEPASEGEQPATPPAAGTTVDPEDFNREFQRRLDTTPQR